MIANNILHTDRKTFYSYWPSNASNNCFPESFFWWIIPICYEAINAANNNLPKLYSVGPKDRTQENERMKQWALIVMDVTFLGPESRI